MNTTTIITTAKIAVAVALALVLSSTLLPTSHTFAAAGDASASAAAPSIITNREGVFMAVLVYSPSCRLRLERLAWECTGLAGARPSTSRPSGTIPTRA